MPRFDSTNPTSLKNLPKEKQREIAKNGAIAAAKKRQKKKLMSEIYADFLAAKHKVVLKDENNKKQLETITGKAYLFHVLKFILNSKGDNASKVRLLKEIREATEGTKLITNFETSNNELIADLKDLFSNQTNKREIDDFLKDDFVKNEE
ncbi:MAG: hypothetical protein LBF97_01305 [Elusimicrobiota bacterium]|jgi:hypothetical protein|nr:hypothetical protein [Elusimicrobiota bacterium]